MNEKAAREILGISDNASFKEIKTAYRRMLLMIHPDKVGQDRESQDQAQRVTSRINQAWEYLEEREKNGLLGSPDLTSDSTNSFNSTGRMPFMDECSFCGFSPAIPISGTNVKTFIFWFSKGKYEMNACKNCGIAMARFSLRESLLRGWWGVGLIFIPQVLLDYFRNMRKLRNLESPKNRDPNVYSLGVFPMFVPRSPLLQPLPILVSLFAIAVIINLIMGSGNSNNYGASNFPKSSSYVGQLGTCYKQVNSNGVQRVQMVDCAGSEATLKSVSEVEYSGSCPITAEYTIESRRNDNSTFVACLEKLGA